VKEKKATEGRGPEARGRTREREEKECSRQRPGRATEVVTIAFRLEISIVAGVVEIICALIPTP